MARLVPKMHMSVTDSGHMGGHTWYSTWRENGGSAFKPLRKVWNKGQTLTVMLHACKTGRYWAPALLDGSLCRIRHLIRAKPCCGRSCDRAHLDESVASEIGRSDGEV